jgi:DNA-binding NarL/FixJ family response regulator
MISAGASIGMRKSVLVVAQPIELRARIARMLQSAGYAVELAESRKRALELAPGGQIEAAIVVDLPGLAQDLRDKVPKTIVPGRRTQEIIRRTHSVQSSDALPVQALDGQKLLEQLAPRSAGSETAPANCKLDLASRTFFDGNGREVQLTRSETALLSAVLTPREREIATLASAGLSNKQIARQSSLVEGTVKIHLHNIYRKLGVKNRTALAALLSGYRLDWTNTKSH